MKLQCDLCREIVVADFVVDGDGIRVHCPACDGRFHVHSSTSTSTSTTTSPKPVAIDGPTITCPKCGLVQTPADACRSCGLRADRMPDYAATHRDDAAPEILAAWAAAVAAWADPDAHERLANAAATHNAYAWVARAYRDHLRAHPGDPVAADRLARITRITEATLRASAAARPGKSAGLAPGAKAPKPYAGPIAILIALVLVMAAGTIYALASTSEPPPDLPPIPVGAPHP